MNHVSRGSSRDHFRYVVLVHGIGDTGAIFGKLSRTLLNHGFRVLTPSLSPNSGRTGLDVLAQQLQQFVDDELGIEGGFDLVGFSMGGLVGRYYLQRLGGLARVERFVTLSTPHHGSLWAHLLPNKGGRQMRPGSSFLKNLNSDVGRLEQLDLLSIWTPFDLQILPASSSHLPIGSERKLPILMHPLVLTDRRCLEKVVQHLQGGE